MINSYCVYKHTFPNDKIYIGITLRNPLKRWGHKGYGYRQQNLMYNAINKYDWDNIKHEILFTDLTKQQAEQKEVQLIAKYKSNQYEYGYNIENGGNSTGKHSTYTRNKISASNKGKTFTEEHKRHISKAKKGYKPSQQTIDRLKAIASKPRSEQAKINISKGKLGSKNPMYNKRWNDNQRKAHEGIGRKVKQLDNEDNIVNVYSTITEASKILGIDKRNIQRSCNTKYKANGFKFEYA